MEQVLIKLMSLAVTALMFIFLAACNSEKKEVAENKADPMEVHENMDMDYGTIDDSIRKNQIPTSEFVAGDTLDFSQEAPAAFKQQLGSVLEAYLALKNGLVAADKKQVDNASTNMMAALLEVNDGLLTGSAHDFWKEKDFFLMDHLELCKEAKTMAGKRENFAFISQAMIKAAEVYGAGRRTLYVQYCPMANGNKGAYWLSEAKEIRNPYMGQQMLTCGETKDTLN
ncbi:DUF3347 domain-containing protein [Pontibacter sp. 172403-2]|uniref:DUF3347 domain-containing protein n=1 Tax=Pontibacter rufus TaxID=2791028 RepID=UPI0018AFCDEF|nr:DUF3347 domain-containing protein [Pontibacter sp. 172403-2]MBF9252195.1 DUF3347 domain-containing protein [Pontibacter sp. 172403-2]